MSAAVDNTSGRRWQRVTLSLSLGASLAANIGHTVLAASAVPVWFRMIGAVWWPLITFLAVEVLIRTVWDTEHAGQRWARRLILFPVLPAAVTSYEHMRAVLLAMGEREFIADFGPLAVDVAMVGCAMALLFTRPALDTVHEHERHESYEQTVERAPAPAAKVHSAYERGEPGEVCTTEELDDPAPWLPLQPDEERALSKEWWERFVDETSGNPAPSSPAPTSGAPAALRVPVVPGPDGAQRHERKRADENTMSAAVMALMNGADLLIIAEQYEVGASTLRKYNVVRKYLAENGKSAELPESMSRGIRPALLEYMRNHTSGRL